MNKKEFVEAMTYLGLAYNKNFTQEHLSVWYSFFKNENLEVFKNTIKRLITTSDYLPSISKFKKEITRIKCPEIAQLNAEEEFEKVRLAIRRFGSYRISELLQSLNPYTAKITSQIGVQRICNSEGITWIKKEFISEFNACLDNYIENLQYNENLLTSKEIENKRSLESLTKQIYTKIEDKEEQANDR